MDLDTFFVSVERLQNSSLNNKPVLIGGTGDRGVVASCSYEARAFGIHAAMPMKRARMLCPNAHIMRGDTGKYSYYSKMVTDVIKDEVPLFEKPSVDEFYIDLTGMDRFFGCYKLATELRKKIIRETGLPISFGLSQNKTVSKIATGEAKPNGQLQILKGEEKPFLAPLSVKKIPMVGEHTKKLLFELGVRRIKTLQEMSLEIMDMALGKMGIKLWRKANGIDNSPVRAYSERKSISTERTFEQDTIDTKKLKTILMAMAESLAYQLRSGNKLTACISVKVRYSDFKTVSKQYRLPYTACDHVIIKECLRLFDELYNRRMRVRLVGVRCSHLVEGGYQINLFDDTEEHIKLYQAMDKIRNKYHSGAIKRAATMHVKTMGGFNLFNGNPVIPLPNRHR